MVGGSTDSGTRQRIDTSVRNYTLRNSGVLRKEKAKEIPHTINSAGPTGAFLYEKR